MKLYCGIDLHSNNHYVSIIDHESKRLKEKRLSNDLAKTLALLEPYRNDLQGIAIESTFNWYWLVDGLMDNGYSVSLVNTSAVKQYEGLKHTDDQYDAYWLAHLMQLGILPTGYIYPKEQRSLRDLMRKRMLLVQCRTSHVISAQAQFWRSTGRRLRSQDIKKCPVDLLSDISDHNLLLSIQSNLNVIQLLNTQIKTLEETIMSQCKHSTECRQLKSVYGIGDILAQTIMLETGDISRFHQVGNYTSYCRCVDSQKTSNGKKKGSGNKKSGNKYLAWAYMEAANFAIRFYEPAKKFYQRKVAKRNVIVARKALAHKLARASYYVMRDHVPFDSERMFS
jgi:transposase